MVVSVEQRPGWTEHVKTMGWVEFRSFEWTARSWFEVVRSLTSVNLGYSWSSSIQAKSRGLSTVYQATLCESLLPSPCLELRSLFCSPKCGWHRWSVAHPFPSSGSQTIPLGLGQPARQRKLGKVSSKAARYLHTPWTNPAVGKGYQIVLGGSW